MKCRICEQGCNIPEGGTGHCQMYTPAGGMMHERYPDSYLAVMPVSIETVPLVHYAPRSKILQVCSIGCTFSCPGCISGVLIGDIEGIAKALRKIPPKAIVARAKEEECSGIVFCLNEPAVAFPSFLRLAKEAKAAGLSVGCSTNGYFTNEALEDLIPFLDYVNVGLKGVTDTRYHACGAAHAAPVFRNIRTCVRRGVHVEASIMYLNGGEEEVLGAAGELAAISSDIPLQVMRFVPFGEACLDEEPTILKSEALCDKLKEILPFVYLFNSPGTSRLNTICPACGETIFTREFYGPMGARTIQALPDALCSCGFHVPIRGKINATAFDEPGMLGGYRSTRAVEMVEAILVCIGAKGSEVPAGFWPGVACEKFIKGLHDRIQTIDGYFGLVQDIGERCGRTNVAADLVGYLVKRVESVRTQVKGAPRPRVFYSMGTPLFALNAGRFEVCLVETAGGYAANRRIPRKGKPGVNISPDEFLSLDPEVIFVSGFLSAPPEDYLRTCHDRGLSVEAVRRNAVYTMPPGWDFGSPRWILGLMAIANTLHPDRCSFNLDEEMLLFYRHFYGTDPSTEGQNRSFSRSALSGCQGNIQSSVNPTVITDDDV